MAPKKEDVVDVLEGISRRSTKDQMMGRLEEASTIIDRLRSKLAKDERARIKKTREIETRVREKYAARPQEPLQNVIVSATTTEIKETVEFLGEFGPELLPTPLQRLLIGGRVLLGESAEGDGETEVEETQV